MRISNCIVLYSGIILFFFIFIFIASEISLPVYFLAYFPKVDLCDLHPVCVCVPPHQLLSD
jgi:hypothetical protein